MARAPHSSETSLLWESVENTEQGAKAKHWRGGARATRASDKLRVGGGGVAPSIIPQLLSLSSTPRSSPSPAGSMVKVRLHWQARRVAVREVTEVRAEVAATRLAPTTAVRVGPALLALEALVAAAAFATADVADFHVAMLDTV